tara:strand:- start:2744 stop:3163 length:420 start_codon:yes stop_codon:yes gene_type:complete
MKDLIQELCEKEAKLTFYNDHLKCLIEFQWDFERKILGSELRFSLANKQREIEKKLEEVRTQIAVLDSSFEVKYGYSFVQDFNRQAWINEQATKLNQIDWELCEDFNLKSYQKDLQKYDDEKDRAIKFFGEKFVNGELN